MSHPTEKDFLGDVAEHAMTVIRDDELHRHIRFRKPGTLCMSFDLITWPGHLCYTGDMGTYVFQRLEDMFQFFREYRVYSNSRGNTRLAINPSYWGEKLESIDRADGYKNWSMERFQEAVKDCFDSFTEGWEDTEKSADLWEQIEQDVLRAEDQYEAVEAIRSFTTTITDRDVFRDFWEHTFDEYSYRFIWCCYALAWGIKQYDAMKMASAGEVKP